MTTLSQRKQYAINCLARGLSATRTRAFDNCFEMNDGEIVSQYILDYIKNAPMVEPDYKDYATKEGDAWVIGLNSPQWKAYRKQDTYFHKALKVKLTLVEGGFTWFIERLKNSDLIA